MGCKVRSHSGMGGAHVGIGYVGCFYFFSYFLSYDTFLPTQALFDNNIKHQEDLRVAFHQRRSWRLGTSHPRRACNLHAAKPTPLASTRDIKRYANRPQEDIATYKKATKSCNRDFRNISVTIFSYRFCDLGICFARLNCTTTSFVTINLTPCPWCFNAACLMDGSSRFSPILTDCNASYGRKSSQPISFTYSLVCCPTFRIPCHTRKSSGSFKGKSRITSHFYVSPNPSWLSLQFCLIYGILGVWISFWWPSIYCDFSLMTLHTSCYGFRISPGF